MSIGMENVFAEPLEVITSSVVFREEDRDQENKYNPKQTIIFMSKWIVSFCLVLISFSSPAQTPGYAGKHHILQIDGYIFPTASRFILQEKSLELNVRSGIGSEHVLNRRLSVKFLGDRFFTNQEYDYNNQMGRFRIQGWKAGIGLRAYTFFRRGNIAPLGIYIQPALHYVRFQMQDLDRRFFPNGRRFLANYAAAAISLALGSQRMIGNRFSYHFGVQSALPFFLFPDKSVPEFTYIKERGIRRLRGFFGINLHAGLGILVF